MARWLRFHLGDGSTPEGRRLLSAASMQAAHTPQPGANGYAFGWQRRTLPSGDGIGHGGTLATFTSDMLISRTGTAAVVLTNTGGDPSQLTTNLLAALDGSAPQPPSNPLNLIDTVFLLLTVLAAALLVTAVVRAPRWARRRRNGRAGLRLLLPALTAGAGLGLPYVLGGLLGQASLAGYLYVAALLPTAAVLAAVLALGWIAATVARVGRLRRERTALSLRVTQ